jgi:hypothetical protein
MKHDALIQAGKNSECIKEDDSITENLKEVYARPLSGTIQFGTFALGIRFNFGTILKSVYPCQHPSLPWYPRSCPRRIEKAKHRSIDYH